MYPNFDILEKINSDKSVDSGRPSLTLYSTKVSDCRDLPLHIIMLLVSLYVDYD